MFNIDKIVKRINKKGITKVDYAIVTGSGLMNAVPNLDNAITVSYQSLGMPKSKVEGHTGNFIFGNLNGKQVVVISRNHYYESGNIEKVRLPLQVVAKLGAETIILMTSCGGINKGFKVGDVMLIEDHINLSGINPLIGIEQISFTNMKNCYDLKLREETKQIANEENIDLREGVHCQLSGPSYETDAEVEMIRKLGGDSVSMSTAHDCIIAKWLGMKVLGFSIIVNVFTNNENENLNHEEVLKAAQLANDKLKKIILNII